MALLIYIEQITDYQNGFCFTKRTEDHSLEYWRAMSDLGLSDTVTSEDWRYFRQVLRDTELGKRLTIYIRDQEND